MQCTGTVLDREGGIARVLIESSGCDQCRACGFGAIREKKSMEVNAENRVGAEKDVRVHLELSGKKVMSASAILFLVPFLAFIIGFLIGYFGINLWFKRLSARHKAVWKNALRHFAKLHPTRGHTGVLIFISVDENEAAIVADKGIAEKLDPAYWQHPHSLIEKAMQKGRHAEGIIEAIQEIATQLAQFFPREADDINELPDGPEIVK